MKAQHTTPKQTVLIYLFDGFSDWELAYLTPQLYSNSAIELLYFSMDGKLVTSMGGLIVTPNKSLAEVEGKDADMLILPGGVAWEKGLNQEISNIVRSLWKQGKSIAAICAATTFLGQQGMLDNVKHTSNAPFYLQQIATSYKGHDWYVSSPAISENHIITANGVATIEFAREIFSELQLMSGSDIEKWFQLFKNGIWSE